MYIFIIHTLICTLQYILTYMYAFICCYKCYIIVLFIPHCSYGISYKFIYNMNIYIYYLSIYFLIFKLHIVLFHIVHMESVSVVCRRTCLNKHLGKQEYVYMNIKHIQLYICIVCIHNQYQLVLHII